MIYGTQSALFPLFFTGSSVMKLVCLNTGLLVDSWASHALERQLGTGLVLVWHSDKMEVFLENVDNNKTGSPESIWMRLLSPGQIFTGHPGIRNCWWCHFEFWVNGVTRCTMWGLQWESWTDRTRLVWDLAYRTCAPAAIFSTFVIAQTTSCSLPTSTCNSNWWGVDQGSQ
jgi:hypothetical protein